MRNHTKKKLMLLILGFIFGFSILIHSNLIRYQGKINGNLKNDNEPELKSAGYWEIEPIFIDDNWSQTANDYWWCHGLGTWEKPYIIENVTIDGKNGKTNCIEIRNSNIYFIIRNCTLTNSSGSAAYYSGIYLSNVRNGMITNNTIGNNMGSGVYLCDGSINNTIFKNTIKNTVFCVSTGGSGNGNNSIIENYIIDGEIRLLYSSNFNNISNNHMSENSLIFLYKCNDNTLLDNIINSDGYFAILLSECERIKLNRNSMNGGGLSVIGSIEQKTSHIIDTSNLVNNKTLYYYINKDNLKPNNFTDAGQVILINCDNSLISYLNISQCASRAISIHYGMNNTITHNNISSQKYWGIYLWESNYNNIAKNILTYNTYGIALYGSNYNNISENIADYNFLRDYDGRGLYLWESNYNIISNNTLTNSLYTGLHLEGSQNNIISYNNISNNPNGITLSRYQPSDTYSINNIIFGNTFFNNSVYGAKLYSGQQLNQFVKNTFIENGINANDDGSNNQWDNGTMGNYWDDYAGVDANDDGIGDTPYDVPPVGGSMDNYPIWDDGDDGDDLAPNIIINSPSMNDAFGFNAPNFEISINDASPINSTWYTIDTGANNYTFSGLTGTVNQTAWNNKGTEIITLRFYANDSAGNLGYKDVIIWKDVIAPIITINSPIPNQLCGVDTPTFSLTIVEPNLLEKRYSLNGRPNITFTTETQFSQTEWNNIGNGTVLIVFYAQDRAGNIGIGSVVVIKSIPSEPAISFELIILISVISGGAVIGVATLLLVRRKRKRIE